MPSGFRRTALFGAFAVTVGLAAWWLLNDRMPTDQPMPTALHFTPLSKPLPVPDVAFIDGNGLERRFVDWRGKGIVLNFWATWCGPCVREMPSLDRLADRVADEGIVVIPLSGDRGGIAVVKAFYERQGLKNLAIYLDPKRVVGAEFGVEFLPLTVFIGRDGLVLGSHSGFAEWDSPEGLALVRRYLGKPGSRARD